MGVIKAVGVGNIVRVPSHIRLSPNMLRVVDTIIQENVERSKERNSVGIILQKTIRSIRSSKR